MLADLGVLCSVEMPLNVAEEVETSFIKPQEVANLFPLIVSSRFSLQQRQEVARQGWAVSLGVVVDR